MLLLFIIIKTLKYFSFLLIHHHFQLSASFGLLLKRCFHDHASYSDRHKACLSSGREDKTSNATSMVMMSLALETVGLKVF